MIILYIILVTTIALIIFGIYTTKKNIKNIGQKIIFLYNTLYIIFIKNYYLNGKQKEEKEEILHYYTGLTNNKQIDNLIQELKKNQKFIVEYYNKDSKQIGNVYMLLEKYSSYYTSSRKTLLLLTLFLIIVILLLIVFIIK